MSVLFVELKDVAEASQSLFDSAGWHDRDEEMGHHPSQSLVLITLTLER
jgi:hypothetical protein